MGEVLHKKIPPVPGGVLDNCEKGLPSTKIRLYVAALLIN
jgi:hypothetical protein